MKEKISLTVESQKEKKQFDLKDIERSEEIRETKKVLEKLETVPPEVREILSKLDVSKKYAEVIQSIEEREREKETISAKEKYIRIGRERTPVFYPSKEELVWGLEGEQFREEGKTMVEMFFKRSDGIEVRPGGAPREKVHFEAKDRFLPLKDYVAIKKEQRKYNEATADLSNEDSGKKEEAEKYLKEFKEKFSNSEWALRALRHLNNLAVERSEEILEKDPYFVETPHVVETMEKFTRLVNRQRERGQGVLILEGDAGTGKNKLVDHFAHLTHRPLFRFTCSTGKDEQDLKYLLEYDSKRGTYRIKSSVVEALETPGAILEFDEINTLKPEVAKILNSLFDHDRALFLGEDRAMVKASDEVIMVGLENPQHYMGVKPLTETIKSRARIMEVTYPPYEKSKEKPDSKVEYRSDEALIIRQHIPQLRDLDQKEFQILWDAEINKKKDPRAADLLTTERAELIGDVKEIVEIANKIRQAYQSYHMGKSDQPLKFIFSLRESVECAYELDDVELTNEEKQKGITKAKKAVKEVVLPKISLGEERTYLATLISEI